MDNSKPTRSLAFVGIVCLALLSACDDGKSTGPDHFDRPAAWTQSAPGPLVSVTPNGPSIWPFTSHDLATPDDPINLVITGETDPLKLRAALVGLDGDRTALGFPPSSPFDCRWRDAIGGLQGAFSESDGWRGSVIQLECGEFQGLRFHVRLFEVGQITLAAAHFETVIPATTEHQVLSWELAEQFLVADLIRTGSAQPMPPTGTISPSPWREIPVQIYNSLPPALVSLIGGPGGPVSQPVGIANDGSAAVLKTSGLPEVISESLAIEELVDFGQLIPKPFCAEQFPVVQVSGPVVLRKTVTVGPENYRSTFAATGKLQITPYDPATGPLAESHEASVNESQTTNLRSQTVVGISTLVESPASSGLGSHRSRLSLTAGGPPIYREETHCY